MKTRHSILIGGTRGVGRELALLFAVEGQTVTVVGRRTSAPPSAVGAGRIIGLAGDAERSADLLQKVRAAVERHGKLSSLVFLQRYRGTGDPWSGELAVTLTATRDLLEGLSDEFDPEGDRSIVLVTSNAGRFVAPDRTAAYHAAKAGLRQLARFYAVQLGPRGIRVNVVSPSAFVKEESAAYYEGHPEVRELYARITPLGRMGTAAEVAQAAAFLCGPKASFITGQELCVDGGLSLRLHDDLARDLAGVAG
jgi:NAD(P)-dependent dehydrogenase (short-subunit alcohol dehydrogenase family)